MSKNQPFPIVLGTFFADLLKDATINNYPPINIIRIDDEDMLKFKLEIGAIGFQKEDIKIELDPSVNKLTVSANGEKEATFNDDQYIHRRLSKKNFIYQTAVPDYTEIANASLENGLLTIDLEVKKPKEQKVKTFDL